jgi:Spermine/spermidine synthase domain
MKDFPVSTNDTSFVERLKQLRTTLSNFLEWFTPNHPFIADKRARTFLISFTILFFELFCIRWIPSYVRYLSYFNNFLLLASFLGIGLGMLSARRERFWFPPFPLLVALLVVIIAKTKFTLLINSTQVLYYGIADQQSARAENFVVLPIIFGMVTLCFIPLAHAFGKLFAQLPPLTAYTFDIIGSLAGIAAFSAMSYFTLPPVAWFSALCVLVLLLSAKRTVLFVAVILAATLIEVGRLQVGAYWSPYYKIILHPVPPHGYFIDVNGTGHQYMTNWQRKEPFYKEVYRIFGSGSFHHALILGAGSGSDSAIALAYGVDSITAVEIDPTIQQLGAQLNPDHPYSNPRVHVVINDGRSFLQNTTDHYDLIIFALPDSLTLTSNNTSLRLESFLLTQDSIAKARTHLTSNGVLVLYNYYRFNWLVQKLSDMVGNAFHQPPLVTTYGGVGRAAAIMAGPRLATLPPGEFGPYHEHPTTDTKKLSIIGQGYFPLTPATPATDDWPFLYLQDRNFPTIYILGLAMVAVYGLVGTVTFAPRKTLRRFDWHMFFLGMAFMLLEVKSLTTFSLLFGSTWLVNSLVFFAILSGVLLAIVVNKRFKFKRISVFYLLLFGVLLLNILLPPDALLLSNPILRYMLASVLAFTPVFLANIIFTNSFRDSETADIAFASNLLGIMVGGGMEYFSMLIGYRLLLIPVIVFYACALLLRLRSRRTPGVLDEAVASEPVLTSQ